MSKALDEYEGRKSCAITTARRLAQFLGDERIKDKGLNCNYVIARRPDNLPTSDRAIPVAIFSTEPSVARTYLRKWCGDISGGAAFLPFLGKRRDQNVAQSPTCWALSCIVIGGFCGHCSVLQHAFWGVHGTCTRMPVQSFPKNGFKA